MPHREHSLTMGKCTSILVAVRNPDSHEAWLGKPVTLARCFGARLEFLLSDSTARPAVERCVAALGYEGEVSFLPHRPDLPPSPDPFTQSAAGTWALRVGPAPWSREMRIVAVVDLSDRDGEAATAITLSAARRIATCWEATLDVLYSECEPRDERVRMERAVRVARLVREIHVEGERLRTFDGPPDKTLPRALAANDYDLVVAGTPSLANLLAKSSPADVMLVN
jgi:hypothetical protein